jgi:recombination associated protein RdgC
MTSWLKHQNHSSAFSIEKSCVLQDANHENRVIRCHNQDLFASSIQSLIKDGCEVKQLALNWQDHINFVLLDDLSMQSIKFSDEIIEQIKEMEAGTKQQQFNADFLIMTETLDGLFKNLLDSFAD